MSWKPRKCESTKSAAYYSQSLSKYMSLQHEFNIHFDEFEFHSGTSMRSELSEPRPKKDSFKQDAASRYCYVNTTDDSSICTTMSLLICKPLWTFYLQWFHWHINVLIYWVLLHRLLLHRDIRLSCRVRLWYFSSTLLETHNNIRRKYPCPAYKKKKNLTFLIQCSCCLNTSANIAWLPQITHFPETVS